jgi:hypothetical protein
MRRAAVVAVTALCVASASAAPAYAHAGGVCRVPRLKGLTPALAKRRAIHAGCRLRVRGAVPTGARTETVERQAPRAGARAASVTVWLEVGTVGKTAEPQAGGRAEPPATPAEAPQPPPAQLLQEPCHGSAEYAPKIEQPLTLGPTELVSGFYLDGGPLVGFSAPGCERPEPPPGAGTVEVLSASGTLVATQTSERGHFIVIPLPPGSYTITGTFLDATVCSGMSAANCQHPTETTSIEVQAGYTVRQDFVLQIP